MASLTESRREFISLVTGAVVVGSAGCLTSDQTGIDSRSSTRNSSGSTITPERGPLTADDFKLDVNIRQEFTSAHPARLQITFENTGTRKLWGQGGPDHTLPFVAEDYAGTDGNGDPRLFLLPDNEAGLWFSFVDNNGKKRSVSGIIPDNATDGCWSMDIDWPPQSYIITPTLTRREVPVGDQVSHEYTLYYFDKCTNGRFTFENRLTMFVGPDFPTSDSENKYEVMMRFALEIDDAGITVSIIEPEIG